MRRLIYLLIAIISFFNTFAEPTPAGSGSYTKTATTSTNPTAAGSATNTVSARLSALNTPIEMRYNSQVQNYIDNYLQHPSGRKQVENILERSSYYMPIFEQALKKAGLPLELKFLPVIESNLEAKAVSPRGAAGLWQFMPIAAKAYDMKITSAIDERYDPYLSSERACTMLKDLYDMFGDWSLVLAAYNSGPGTVQRALKRAGGNASSHSFWTISQYLPAQTRKYVPKFIAMTYVMLYYSEHNVAEVTDQQPVKTDTIHFTKKASLKDIASVAGVSVEELRKLNPHYRTDVVPATTARHCTVILPEANADTYREKLGIEKRVETAPAVAEERVIRSVDPVTKKITLEKPRRRTRTVDEYEEVPSSTFPNAYLRKKRSTTSSRKSNTNTTSSTQQDEEHSGS